jgi:N-acetylmuramic acid 6-phosphate etherase
MSEGKSNRRLGGFVTEMRNPASRGIDTMSIARIIELMQEEDLNVVAAIKAVRHDLVKVIERTVQTFRQDGSLIYVGAGTSGRLGVLDAAECPPTFGTDRSMVRGIIAGGREALWRSVEGAEDDEEAGREAIARENVSEIDTVIGIAASVDTPFVMGALGNARRMGCYTVLITFNPDPVLPVPVDQILNPVTGPEVIAGSTRMKAGTATKMVLNMITTISMIKLGKAYDNLMVDLQCLSEKLRDRGRRILVELLDIEYDDAGRLLKDARWQVKNAIVMGKLGLSYEQAGKKLIDAEGFVSVALGERSGSE